MCYFIKLIQSIDSDELKNWINIFFWIFTAIFGWLTYKNAKKSLFNPIRTEMVKDQLKSITDFNKKYYTNGKSIDTIIDYINLLKINIDMDYVLHILNNEDKFNNFNPSGDDEKIIEYCKNKLAATLEINEQNRNLTLELSEGNFDIMLDYARTGIYQNKEKKYEYLLLRRFYLTKDFLEYYTDLTALSKNPFVNDKIKDEILILIKNIHKNVSILYKICGEQIYKQTPNNYYNLYNEFLKQKINHQLDLDNINIQISIYFKVNEL